MFLLSLLLACQTPEPSGSGDGPSDSATVDDSGAADDTGDGSACAEGFSGADCDFCTFESAGEACHPGAPADLFDLDAIKALTLDDLGWTVTSTAENDDGTVIIGDMITPFAGVTADGEDMDVDMTSKVAVYIPAGWPDDIDAQARGKAFVQASHFSDNVDSTVAATIAKVTGMPVVFHGEYPENFTQLGYDSKKTLNQSAWEHVFARNTCEPADMVRGNYRRYMAEVDMRAITLAQRLAEQAGAELDQFALRGYSKEGHAAWLALTVDDRVVVGGPGGSPFQDLRAYSENLIEQIGCEGDPDDGESVSGAVQALEWHQSTPAGAYRLNTEDLTLNQEHIKARFVLIDGDSYQPGSHDGNNFVLGAEDTFLDALTAVPFRYARKAESALDDFGEDGDATSKSLVPYLVAEALYRDDDPTEWYPKVDLAEASISDGVLSAYAEVSGNPETVALWATYSEDRSWSEEGQAPWVEFTMAASGDGWAVDVDLTELGVEDMVIAWYAEGRNTLALGESEYARKDGTPIRFLQEPEAGSCDDVEPVDFCEQE